ncbi:MFS transporter [Paenibacillus terrigena]|uniref:MFS transporter n=1 Tax=Paenibacillus terrigena TaxID=369333 RepID=UPI0028D06710|nr:MFS transporter [Paenibacillus terrigena]
MNLFFLTFVLGTSEFVIVGLLTEVSSSLRITISTAGALVSAFALSFAIATPVLTAIFSRFSKYPLMLILIAIFIAGNLLTALSDSYGLLLASRIMTAVVTGVLITLAMTVASVTMPAEHRSKVISIIFAGFTIASVVGVPLGTSIGQWGGWQMAFWFTALLGLLSLLASSTTIPRGLIGSKGSIQQQIQLLANSRIIIAFCIPALSITATYTVYTYLTALMQDVLFIPDRYISLVFMLYGVITVFSTLIGGKIAAHHGISKLRFVFLIQGAILASLYWTSQNAVAGIFSLCLIALVVYMMNSTMQLYFIDLADRHSPSARDLASSLTPVSINVGIALGAAIGGYVSTHLTLIDISWVGALAATLASLLTFVSYRLDSHTCDDSMCQTSTTAG